MPMSPMLADVPLSAAERQQITEVLRTDVVANREYTAGLNAAELNDEVIAQRARLVDLNGDGQPELLLQSNGTVECVDDDSGNCTTRVLSRQNGVWHVVLREQAEAVAVDAAPGREPVLILYRVSSPTRGNVSVYEVNAHAMRASRISGFNVSWPDGVALQGTPKLSAGE
jgi:hypothetical protein